MIIAIVWILIGVLCLTGKITTKQELLYANEEIAKELSDLNKQLKSLKEEVDFLIQHPKNRITRMKQPKNLNEIKISENVKVISILEIKERINAFLREYGLIKTDVNHTFSARKGFNLTPQEEETSRTQKRKSDNLQTDSNKLNNDLNDFTKWIDCIPCDSDGNSLDGGV